MVYRHSFVLNEKDAHSHTMLLWCHTEYTVGLRIVQTCVQILPLLEKSFNLSELGPLTVQWR